MADYVKLAAIAKKLIEANGRSVVLKKETSVPSDASKPWRAGSATPAASQNVVAVILDYKAEELNGDHVRRGDKKAMVAQESLTGIDLRGYNRLLDGTETWSIVGVEVLAPGNGVLLYEFQLRQ